MRVGYACICLGQEELRCQRSTILKNATPERLRALIHANLDGLEQILELNEQRGLRLFRLGNDFIPFASHPVNELRWWDDYGYRFRSIGKRVRAWGHRISFHASHYTILNSANPAVVASALADVHYMGRVLEAMELGPEHKIILHGGISTPTFPEAEARLEAALAEVAPEHRRHLVLENDERFYSARRMIDLSARVGLPVVVDTLHHACHPDGWDDLSPAALLRRVFATWTAEDGPPKIHFSSQDPEKKRGAHHYWIEEAELESFLAETRGVATDFDIMFEAKGKDLAVMAVLPVLEADPRFRVEVRAA
ncbi:MAG: UV DNA damage repair endonuclease UvsE [Armatimonadota bacterium]